MNKLTTIFQILPYKSGKFLITASLFLAAGLRGGAFAQDVHFSQFYTSPVIINPGATGAFDGKMRAALNYRNQWSAIGSPYQTYSAAFEMAALKKKTEGNYLGIGAWGFTDRAGNAALAQTQFNLSLAYNSRLNSQQNIAVGLQGGYAQRAFDYSKLTWDNQYDGSRFVETLGSGEVFIPNTHFIDVVGGALWNYRINEGSQFNAGVSASHLNKPVQSLLNTGSEKLNIKFIVHGGGRFGKSANLMVLPEFMYALQGTQMEINAGAMVRKLLKESSKYTGYIKGNAIYFGGNYRFNDALILATMLEIADWKIGVSYDVNISGFTKATTGRGGFELSVAYLKPD